MQVGFSVREIIGSSENSFIPDILSNWWPRDQIYLKDIFVMSVQWFKICAFVAHVKTNEVIFLSYTHVNTFRLLTSLEN